MMWEDWVNEVTMTSSVPACPLCSICWPVGQWIGLALTGSKRRIFLFVQIEPRWTGSMRTGLVSMMQSFPLSPGLARFD